MHYLLDNHNNDISSKVTLSKDFLADIAKLAEKQVLEPQALIRMSIAKYLERLSDSNLSLSSSLIRGVLGN